MRFEYDSVNDLILLESKKMLDFYGNPSLYNTVDVVLKFNDSESITVTFDSSNPITTTGDIYIYDPKVAIKPQAFNIDEYQEGVYSIQMIFRSDNIYTDTFCGFINKTADCSLYDFYISDAKDELKKKAVMIYYMLNSSNLCPCECDNIYQLYSTLLELTDKDCVGC